MSTGSPNLPKYVPNPVKIPLSNTPKAKLLGADIRTAETANNVITKSLQQTQDTHHNSQSPSKRMNNGRKNDHSLILGRGAPLITRCADGIRHITRDALTSLTWIECGKVFVTLLFGLLIHFYGLLFNMLHLIRYKGSKKNGDLVQISEHVWQISYFSGHSATCTVLRCKSSGDLLLVSPCPPQQHTLEQLAEIGHVEALLMPSFCHDLFTPAWKELHPSILLIANKSDRFIPRLGGETIKIDKFLRTSECEEILDRFGITQTIPSNSFSRVEDNSFVLNLDNGRRGVLLQCGFCNLGLRSYFDVFDVIRMCLLLNGMGGLRITRQYALLCIQDLDQTQALIDDICDMRPDIVMFQHGVPCHDVSHLRFMPSPRSLFHLPRILGCRCTRHWLLPAQPTYKQKVLM
eukprot:gb/GEZN01008421.1/.p1 GENE.gb/GEZN01008421.1/~~gb/GEZN01008421.1/.p1  ORF type:complete len:421 (+),score=20.56 gb/GEZN01008421.1/:49-1263(+)